jgi:hypothetical protein
MTEVLKLTRPCAAAAAELQKHRETLAGEIDSVVCNHVYERDGHRPMVALDLHVAEEIANTLERVCRLLSRLEGA